MATVHVPINVIELARDNNIHLLCLPPHILQPLDVSVFKSLKNFSKACIKYLATNPGQVGFTCWPHSLTALNVMSGFKNPKCGIFPLSPSEIDDGQIAPQKLFTNTKLQLTVIKKGMQVMSQWIQIVHSSLLKRGSLQEEVRVRGMMLMTLGWLKINYPAEVSSICTVITLGVDSFTIFQDCFPKFK